MSAAPNTVLDTQRTLDSQVIYGDALAVLRTLPRRIAQTCVTSPPYWSLKDYATRSWIGGRPDCEHESYAVEQESVWRGGDGAPVPSRSCSRCGAWFGQLGLEATVEAYVSNLVTIFAAARPVLRDDGTLWVNMGDLYNAYGNRGPSQGLSARGDSSRPTWIGGGLMCPTVPGKSLIGLPGLVACALKRDAWIQRNEIIWVKQRAVPERMTDRFPRVHEQVLMFSKNKRAFFQRAPGRLDTVWTIPTERGRGGHPAPYPRELARRCIEAGTKRGDLVLDPFAGSGTTLEVAAEMGRQYLGIELNGAYGGLIDKRVQSAVERARQSAALRAVGLG